MKILVFFLAALMPVAAAAQTAPDASPAPAASPGATAPAQPAATESDAQKAADLQAAAANPIASMISVPFQYNANFSYGPYKGIQQVLNVQPVIPTNLGGGHTMFAHDPDAAAEVIGAAGIAGRPLWAKLSPNTDRVVEVAAAVRDAGAEAVTLVNTLLGMVLHPGTGLAVLGAGGGGYSGRPLHAVAVRTVYDVHAALPDLPIVGVGGVATAWDAAELLLAGASAVQVGTATFADPAAPLKVQRGLLAWCAERGLHPADLCGMAHRGGMPPHG